jgi:hypothetical protein
MKLIWGLVLLAVIGMYTVATNDFFVVKGFRTQSIEVQMFNTKLIGVDADGQQEVLYSSSISRSMDSEREAKYLNLCYDMFVSKSKSNPDSEYRIFSSTPTICPQ